MTQHERLAALEYRAPQPWRYVLLGLAACALILALLFAWDREFRRTEQLRTQIARSYALRLDQTALLSSLKDVETAQRGYLLTGSAAFLEPFGPARADIREKLAKMRAAGDPDIQAAYTQRIDALVSAKLSELTRTVDLERTGHHADALARVRSGYGKEVMDQLRGAIGSTIDRESRRLADRRSAYLAKRTILRTILTTASVVVVLASFGFLAMLWRLQKARYRALVEAFEAAERNAAVLDSTIDAILIINPSGTIEVMNAAAVQMLGYSIAELGRRDIGAFIDIAPGDGSFHKRVGLVDGQLRRSFFPDRTIRHRNGREMCVDVAVGVMRVPSGDHLVASLRDVSERKRIEQVKDDLISTVSHELRTPLTSIVGSLGLLRAGTGGRLPDEAGQLVDIAENNSRRLIRLINDMLDIDRIESGKLHVSREPIDVRIVVDDACTGSEGLARAKEVTLDCAKPEQPVMVSADGDRLLQVMTNLVSNAVRAAPSGSAVEISLSVDGDRAIVAIDDRGPGIPTAFRDRIFGRFERASQEGESTGTGLGLAISREIIARHDGTIWFEDRVGGGTRFAFALPRLGMAIARDVSAPRILVCEQDKATAARLIATIINEGCAYDLVESVTEARAAMSERAYSALLVDLNLPEEGGLAFVRALRDGETPFAGAVIIVSSEARNDGAAIAPLDVVDWIDKPADADRIAAALRSAVLRSGARCPIVLHLDDDRDLLNVVAKALAPEIEIVTATDLASARAILQHTSPDAVILDIQLAHESGLELMPFLVDADGLAIPTIIYSAQDVAADLVSHVDAVLVKARGSIPDLKSTIRRLVRDRGEGEAG